MILPEIDELMVSPRVGLVFDLTKTTRIHAGYARYFTPPPTEKIDTTTVGLFSGTTNALPSDANTAVSSERSHYFDAGVVLEGDEGVADDYATLVTRDREVAAALGISRVTLRRRIRDHGAECDGDRGGARDFAGSRERR